MTYADADYYTNIYKGSLIAENALEKALKDASQQIDTLTYNRIHREGFERLTEFRKEIVQETVCKLADFNTENADVLNMILGSYAINGVSMEFGKGWNVGIVNGIPISPGIYGYLEQSGLCCASLGRWEHEIPMFDSKTVL